MDSRSFFEEPDCSVFILSGGYNRLWRCSNCKTYLLMEQQLEVHASNCSKAIKEKQGNIQNIFIESININ